jgi:acyl-CoA thioesterase-1
LNLAYRCLCNQERPTVILRRRPLLELALITFFSLGAGTRGMAQTQEKPKATRPQDPSLAPIKDEPGLPRVLLIGDSISMGYTTPVREALKGKANVHRPTENCGPTSRGVERLENWLGQGHWDVIHFNFGLHDLRIGDGKLQVALDQYEQNLRTIVARLKRTGATLIWCSTTPVPEKTNPPRRESDVLAYNAVARKIMDENSIRIDDLHAFTLPRQSAIQRPDNVHFSAEGSKVRGEQVAASIAAALGNRAAK